MKKFMSFAVAALMGLSTASVSVAETGTLKIKFEIDGSAPAPTAVKDITDPVCADHKPMDESLQVSSTGGIKNIAVYIDKKTKVDIPKAEAPATPVVLDNVKCVFEPRVFFCVPGQTVEVKNSDATGHNARFNFVNNTQVNFLVPSNTSKTMVVKSDEPAPIPVECNIHPWMRASIIVQEHGFVGISNEEGVLEIKDIPAGDIVFKVWHEKTRVIDDVTVDGKKEKWARGRFEYTIKAGENDMGVVKIPADAFN